MHNEWLDLIPFYVAGTLSQSDMVALEHHLARCESCFGALSEWREVATVVRREAQAWGEILPPLSNAVRAQLVPSSQNGYKHTQNLSGLVDQTTVYVPAKSRRSTRAKRQLRPSLSLIAAIFVVVIFSGILLYGVSQSGKNDGGQYGSQGENPPAARTATNTPLILPSLNPLTPSLTITPFVINNPPQTIRPVSTIAPATLEDCWVIATTTVDVYRYADTGAIITDILVPGDSRRAVVTTGTGWYQIGNDQQLGIIGWVSIEDVTLEGDCDSLVTPSATPYGTPNDREVCLVGVAIDGLVNLYIAPGPDFEIVSTLQVGEFLRTDARTQDNWYRVILENGNFLAWVYFEDIETNGTCDNLPVIGTSTIVPSPTVPSDVCLLNSLSGFGLHLYAGPGLSYDIINNFSDPLVVTGLSDNGWYRVERRVGNVRWIGWVAEENATITTGICDGLPVIPSAGYIPNPMPSVTPTMASPSPTPQLLPTSRN